MAESELERAIAAIRERRARSVDEGARRQDMVRELAQKLRAAGSPGLQRHRPTARRVRTGIGRTELVVEEPFSYWVVPMEDREVWISEAGDVVRGNLPADPAALLAECYVALVDGA